MKSKKAKVKRQKPKGGNKSECLLVLTGFMGTGKTSVGRLVADELGREFVDMDVVIEEREGKPIREIFAQRGEDHFRAVESQLCAELGLREKLVIATGGGALLNSRNRACFANAFVVCLDASLDEILRRLDGATDRPLLADGEARQRVQDLLSERQQAYAQIERHVNTVGKSTRAIASQIIARFREAMA